MGGRPIACQTQMSFMDQTEPLWYERIQDMSGYVLPETTLPLSDEQIQFEFSTAQHENDIDVQNSENPSPEEYIIEDPLDAVLGEDSNMFSSNYSLIDTEIKAWLPKISNTEIDEFAKTSMIEENRDFRIQIIAENPPIFSEALKVEKKLSSTVLKKLSYLSIFDCEEPVIKEDLESLSSCCNDNKLAFELKDNMEVAEEVVVTTEYYNKLESKQSPFLFNSASLDCPAETVEEVVITSEAAEDISSPLRDSSPMETPYYFNMDFDGDEDLFYGLEPVTPPDPEPKMPPKLHLDLVAALATSSQLPLGGLPDTPDVLQPVLDPGMGFDLINFLTSPNSDSNNNATTFSAPSSSPSNQRPCNQQRKGKSQLSLADLKESQSRSCDGKTEPIPGPSSPSTSSSQRPTRKSATKFKKRIQGGLLNLKDSRDASSDEEGPTTKQRRTTSSSCNRKRLNSDSDQASVCENSHKYRERRDRNNISSKRSRQKRKAQQELKEMELKELEGENRRLKKRAQKLVAALDRVHAAWKEYLRKINKEK